MAAPKVLVAGCGDLGIALARRLIASGAVVTGLRREAARLPAGIAPLAADMADASTLAPVRAGRWDAVVVAGAPGGFDPVAYRRVYVDGLANLLAALQGAVPVVLVSSTGVYHQSQGEWVDEDSPTEPEGFSGRALLEGEKLLGSRTGAPSAVLRLGGIYGPGRGRLLEEVRSGVGCPREPVRYTNRIHRDDAAAILAFLVGEFLAGRALAPLWLGVDCDPAPMWEVRHWIAERLGVALDDSRGGAIGSRGGNKRVSNRRLLDAGYRFIYPDYRAGYGAMIRGG